MSGDPELVVTDDMTGTLATPGTVNGMLVGGTVLAVALNAAARVPAPVGFAAGAVAIPAVLFAVGTLATRDSTVRFYDDRVETETPFDAEGWGSWPDRTIPYEEIDLVVRRDDRGDRLAGTGSFELIAGGEHLKLSSLTDPERVERTLIERVPDPSARGDGDRARHTLWDVWPAEVDRPDEPVVGELELAERLDVYLHGADLEELVPDFEGGSALDRGPEGGITAADFDAGGDESTVLGMSHAVALALSLFVLVLGAAVLTLGLLRTTPGVEGRLTPVQWLLQVGAGLLVTMLGLSFVSQTLAARAYRRRGIGGR